MKISMFTAIAVCLMFSSFNVKAADDPLSYTNGVSTIIKWVKNLDKVLLSMGDDEKLLELNTLLGNISLDISKVSTKKSDLALHIRVADISKPATVDKLIVEINAVQNDIGSLVADLNHLESLVNDSATFSTMEQVKQKFQMRKEIILDNIKSQLKAGNVDKNSITAEAGQAVDIAGEANKQILSARDKVTKKLNHN